MLVSVDQSDLSARFDATEALIIGWTQEVLGIDEVGPDDDLLALGANSLSIIMLGDRLRDDTGIDLPLERFFTTGSIRELAREIDTLLQADTSSSTGNP